VYEALGIKLLSVGDAPVVLQAGAKKSSTVKAERGGAKNSGTDTLPPALNAACQQLVTHVSS
jgi:hypothetical protein